MRHLAATLVLAVALPLAAHAQSPAPDNSTTPQGPQQSPQRGDGRGAYAGMGHVMGEITAVNGASLTLKTEDGTTATVVTTDNTRMMKDRSPARLSDLHPGDGVVALGNMDAPTHTLHAAMLMVQDAAQVKAMRENLGKTYITGRVKAIDLDNARMTVERPDHVAQTIGFDETTSFRRAVRRGSGEGAGPSAGMGRGMGNGAGEPSNSGESITLADIKVGDIIAGTGSVKNGTFVPTQLVDRPAGQHRPHGAAPAGAPTEGPR